MKLMMMRLTMLTHLLLSFCWTFTDGAVRAAGVHANYRKGDVACFEIKMLCGQYFKYFIVADFKQNGAIWLVLFKTAAGHVRNELEFSDNTGGICNDVLTYKYSPQIRQSTRYTRIIRFADATSLDRMFVLNFCFV